jgi:hypothetical protein
MRFSCSNWQRRLVLQVLDEQVKQISLLRAAILTANPSPIFCTLARRNRGAKQERSATAGDAALI